MTKAILKLNWNLSYIGDVDSIIKISDEIKKLTPVEFYYLNEMGGVYVEREDCSEIELEFLNNRPFMSRKEYEDAKDKELNE
jgi:hypothetical protein